MKRLELGKFGMAVGLIIAVNAGSMQRSLAQENGEVRINVGNLDACIAQDSTDRQRCVFLESAACQSQPTKAPNALRQRECCDHAEMQYWQALLDVNVERLMKSRRGEALDAFVAQQSRWVAADDDCNFP